MTHHSVMISLFRINIKKIDCNFSTDIDYNVKTDVIREVIYYIINQ